MGSVAPDMSYDIVVVGAGFSGLYLLHNLREAGFSVRLLEEAPRPGGIW
jgi:cation diffusion facilitator CzcD-associated flavoprotein CzcO